jgi:predicted ATP-grasp superfamily ATP-dependent carboligase
MASSYSVLVYEYFTGGGCPAGQLHAGLAVEALGMVCALLMDFHRLGYVRTLAALDPRVEAQIPWLNRKTFPADEVVRALPAAHEEAYLSLLERCDAVLILAPETNGILSELTALAEMAGKQLLNSSASAVAAAGDKEECDRIFRRAGLPTPETRTADFASVQEAAREMGSPVMIKPIDGIGSEGVYRVDSLSDLPAVLLAVRRISSHDRILLQSFAAGIPASVSLLFAGGRCLPLSLNRQLMEGRAPFQYLGSEVPFRHPASEYALELACAAASQIEGMNGYVGVDLVLGEELVQLIEINPRLTTSYVGLRQVAQVNLAHAIWEACVKGILPNGLTLSGRVVIRKDDPKSWGLRLTE